MVADILHSLTLLFFFCMIDARKGGNTYIRNPPPSCGGERGVQLVLVECVITRAFSLLSFLYVP